MSWGGVFPFFCRESPSTILRRAVHGFAGLGGPYWTSPYTLIVLSAPPVMSREPVWSKVEQKMPDSASSDPGWGTSVMVWNGRPVL